MMERRRTDRRAGAGKHPVVQAFIVFFAGLAAVFCVLLVAHPVVFSLCVSLALYAVLSPAVDHFRQRGWPTAKAAGSVMGMATVGLVLVGALLYPLMMMQVHQVSEQLTHLDQQLLSVLTDSNDWLLGHGMSGIDPHKVTDTIIQRVGDQGSTTIASMTHFFGDIATSLLLIPLITFFLLCDFLTLRNEAMQLLPNRFFEMGWLIYIRAATQLQSYIRGVSIQAVIMASVTGIGFWIAGIDYAPLLGIMVGLLNVIPFFGISLAKVPPIVAVLLSSNPDAMHIIMALAVVMVGQGVDNGYVIPRIIAKAASLHPLTVMIGVMLGGYYFGFFGLILTVPVMFSCKVIMGELIRGLKRKALNVRMESQCMARAG